MLDRKASQPRLVERKSSVTKIQPSRNAPTLARRTRSVVCLNHGISRSTSAKFIGPEVLLLTDPFPEDMNDTLVTFNVRTKKLKVVKSKRYFFRFQNVVQDGKDLFAIQMSQVMV